MKYRHDDNFGYLPAIPEPFYEQWWFGWQKRFVCVGCGEKFKSHSAYECHYVLNHIEEDCASKTLRTPYRVESGKIIATPPVWSRFKGLHLYRLTWWLTAKFTACQCVPMTEEKERAALGDR